jgi:hypothetical protein
MKTEIIGYAHATVGRDVTVWYGDGNRGQGGVVFANDATGITIIAPGDRTCFYEWDQVDHITAEVPFDADECLEYGPDCSGPVELHWAGGQRSWPRCTHHGEQRRERYENSLERYADSDVVPDWFDPTYAGERWEDDY